MYVKIPLLVYYSDSHSQLYEDFFFPSFLKNLSEDFELVVAKSQQLCNGGFASRGWNEQMKEKIGFVNDFLQKTESQWLVFSDVDIVFFKNIKHELFNELGDVDIIFQSDSGCGDPLRNLCCGFFMCKVNELTRTFFKLMMEEYSDKHTDQQNLNFFLSNQTKLKFTALSKNFFNLSFISHEIWDGHGDIRFPEYPILMYHANFTVGIANKETLLRSFSSRMQPGLH